MADGWQVTPEEQYVAHLEHERRMFAWCLVTYGGYAPEAATREALESYPYEPREEKYRDLVFHDEAWHWAMLMMSGGGYWQTHPDRARASEAYRAESDRLWISRG